MTIILSYCHKDASAAFALARLIATRTDMEAHELILYSSQHAPLPTLELVEELKAHMKLAVMRCDNDTKDYPLGANLMFAGLMTIIAGGFEVQDTIFLAEADAFPTSADWANRIEAAHGKFESAVSGHWIDWVEPNHYNGNMVLDREFILRTPVLRRPVFVAWDCHHAEWLAEIGAGPLSDNPEILLPQKPEPNMPAEWWFAQRKNGKRPSYIHGQSGFAIIDRLQREGFPAEDSSSR